MRPAASSIAAKPRNGHVPLVKPSISSGHHSGEQAMGGAKHSIRKFAYNNLRHLRNGGRKLKLILN